MRTLGELYFVLQRSSILTALVKWPMMLKFKEVPSSSRRLDERRARRGPNET